MYEITPAGLEVKAEKEYEFDNFLVRTVNPEQIKEIEERLRKNHERLMEMSIDEIIDILSQVGDLWKGEYREIYLGLADLINNKSRELNEEELRLSTEFLNKEFLTALADAELGDRHLLDKWVEIGFVYVKRQPLGLVLHNLAGNAMITATSSFTYGLLSKNLGLVKTPTEDPISAALFAESILEVDKKMGDFFVVLYWPGKETEYYRQAFEGGIDGVLQWGGKESTESIKKMAPYGTKIVEHGPKLSFAVVENLEENLGYKLAYDASMWEQRACLSPRVVFVKREIAREVLEEVIKGMEEINKEFPEEKTIEKAMENREKIQKYILGGNEVYYKKGELWAVVYKEGEITIDDVNACMNRFLIIKPYDSLDEVISFLDNRELKPYLQTFGYNGNNKEFINKVTYLGVAHVTKIGEMNYHMPGFSHDGVYNLAELTKVVSKQKKVGI